MADVYLWFGRLVNYWPKTCQGQANMPAGQDWAGSSFVGGAEPSSQLRDGREMPLTGNIERIGVSAGRAQGRQLKLPLLDGVP